MKERKCEYGAWVLLILKWEKKEIEAKKNIFWDIQNLY
jgi:hypothetical protein